ncbi:hypothetical protein Syun_020771 [Stephania yunnanensis]|uniref:Uncharacterized protein n=1 Tax=Stephania yunnanensis TaxID=152371 RepID=A0AAP0IEF6_9MAGN
MPKSSFVNPCQGVPCCQGAALPVPRRHCAPAKERAKVHRALSQGPQPCSCQGPCQGATVLPPRSAPRSNRACPKTSSCSRQGPANERAKEPLCTLPRNTPRHNHVRGRASCPGARQGATLPGPIHPASFCAEAERSSLNQKKRIKELEVSLMKQSVITDINAELKVVQGELLKMKSNQLKTLDEQSVNKNIASSKESDVYRSGSTPKRIRATLPQGEISIHYMEESLIKEDEEAQGLCTLAHHKEEDMLIVSLPALVSFSLLNPSCSRTPLNALLPSSYLNYFSLAIVLSALGQNSGHDGGWL